MAISVESFKSFLSGLAGVVTVITTCDSAEQPWGFTASSLCSLSLEPPLVLFCLANTAECYPTFMSSRYFAINVLTAQQSEISQRFASKGRAKYDETPFMKGSMDLPLIPGALANQECSVQASYPGGDHMIIVGQVEYGVQTNPIAKARPLLYYSRNYGTFAPLSFYQEQGD